MNGKSEKKIKLQEIYLLKYKTNQSDDMKYKAFETLELATLFHLSFKEIVTKLGYPNREIIHHEIIVIPFNLDASKMLNQIKKVK
ncbi:hypothetical protein [Spiroplasma endosymbiont of Polydrusus pterygomalis]|uniref:hypothetical protein n=1 Tax=Spiroplasma endosymbiont of Polydrusus pterygomalis TaxID=3139327 RepID=UPI003CCA8955